MVMDVSGIRAGSQGAGLQAMVARPSEAGEGSGPQEAPRQARPDGFVASPELAAGEAEQGADRPLPFVEGAREGAGGGQEGAKAAQDHQEDQALVRQAGGQEGDVPRGAANLEGDDVLKGMEARDQEVRTHEEVHQREAGEFAVGGPTYETVDSRRAGKSFAVGGKVRVDTSEIEGDPRKTLEKMKKIQRAALAPDDPSAQDRKVANEAAVKEQKARGEVQKLEEKGGVPGAAGAASNPSGGVAHDERLHHPPGEPAPT